jgi:polysaccharide pyruvyl transferase WcaK-like protein
VKLHTVIAACCVSTPAIMIGYQPKCLDFMRTMRLEDYYVRADQLDLDNLLEKIAATTVDLESVQRRQHESVQRFRCRLLGFRDWVADSLGECSSTNAKLALDGKPSAEGIAQC